MLSRRYRRSRHRFETRHGNGLCPLAKRQSQAAGRARLRPDAPRRPLCNVLAAKPTVMARSERCRGPARIVAVSIDQQTAVKRRGGKSATFDRYRSRSPLGRLPRLHHGPTRSAKSELVDTHGAGDAFIGALAARLASGASVAEAVRFANAAAALFVSMPSDQKKTVTSDRVIRFLSERHQPTS